AEVAEYVEEEEAILGRRVAEPELRSRACAAVDVRDAVVVAHDRHVLSRAVLALDVARLDSEAGVLEEAVDAGVVQGRVRVEEVAVERELVVAVRRTRLGGLEAGEVDGVVEAVL